MRNLRVTAVFVACLWPLLASATEPVAQHWSMPVGFTQATGKPAGTRESVIFHSPWAGKICVVLASKDGWVAHDPPPTLNGGYGMAIIFLFDPDTKVGNKDTRLFSSQEGGFFKITEGGKSSRKSCN